MGNPVNGNTSNISNTPQAKDDVVGGGVEAGRLLIDVMGNDLGGAAKHLYSVNQASPAAVAASATTALGGTVTIVGDQIQYDATGARIEALGAGQTAVDTFSYVIQLGNGTLSVATVSVTVTGTNDAPLLAADPVASHALSEVAGVTGASASDAVSGSLAFSDIDLNDHHTVAVGAPVIVWSAGGGVPAATASALASALSASVSHDSTGTGAGSVGFNFSVADKLVDFLGEGQTLTLTYNVSVSDGHGGVASRPVSVVITGTNDAPVAVVDTAATTENQAVTVDVLANDTDVDNGASRSLLSVSAPTGEGVAAIVGGKLVFTPGADFDHLAQGATQTVTLTYVMSDEHGAQSSSTVTLTVTGTNDAPVVTPLAATATEGQSSAAIDALSTASDVDDGAHLTVVGVPAALPAGVTYDAVTHSFALNAADPAYDHLAAGDTQVVSVSYGVSDGLATTANTVSWTITGTNDAPVVSGAVTGQAVEAGATVALEGLAHAADVDDHTTLTVVGVPASLPAGVSYDAASHSFTLDPTVGAYDHLAQGATQVVSVSYGVSDGTATTPATVSWTITGTNDAPVATAISSTATEGDPAPHVVDALSTASDIDDGAQLAVVGVPAALPAGVTYDAVTHSFALNAADPAYDHLAAGDTQVVSVSYGVSDGLATTANTVSWTITGVNDAPSVAGAVTGQAVEAGATVALEGLAHAADVDDHTTLTVVGVPASLPAGVSYDAASHSFTLDPTVGAYDHLAQGATQVVSVSYGVSDGTATTPATVSWTITGTNDAPVATAISSTATEGDLAPHVVDALSTASDVDDGAQLAVVGVPAALPAGVTYDAATHSFALNAADPAYDHLAAGDTQVVSVSYGVSDGLATTANTVSWTITGANDAPSVAGAVTGQATEGVAGSVALNALAQASDVDDHTTLSVVNLPALPAGVTFDAATQTFSLDPTNAAYDHLAAGATQVVTVNYGVSDGTATTAASASWTITGTNDAPTVVTINVASNEGGNLILFNATVGDHDVDDGAVLSPVVSGPLPAGVSYNASTSTFQLNPQDAAFNHLAAGETQVVSFTYGVTDGQATTTETANWTVTGTNDAPVLGAQVSNLVQNGDFSQGAAHWTDPSGGPEIGNTGTYGVSPSTNGAVLELDSGNNFDDVSQTVATVAGQAYTFSFDAANRSGTSAATNAFQVLWNGQVIDTVTPGSTTFANHSYTVVGSGAVGTVEFREINNDSLGGIIDNVSLKPTVVEVAGQTGSSALDSLTTTLTLSDPDLSDHHSVAVGTPSISFSGAGVLPGDLATTLASALSTHLTEAAGSGTLQATFAAADKTFDFMHAGDTLTVTYNVTVDDGHGGTAVQPVSFTISGTNDAPQLAAPIADQSANMLQAFSYAVPAGSFTDVDNSNLTYTAHLANGAALPSWLTFNAATQTFSGTPQGADVGTLSVVVTASDGSLQASDTFNLDVHIVNQALVGAAGGESLTGDVGADTLSGLGGNDTLLGGAGNDVIWGDATGVSGPAPTASFQLSAVAAADLAHNNTLVTPVGSSVTLPANDDGSSAAIDIRNIFGATGLNFFGAHYTNIFVNNNGNITFGAPNAAYVPSSITAGTTPIIAPFWADVDTRGGATPGNPNTVSYNLDAQNGVFTVTWDHVGYYENHTTPSNTFQLQLINEGNGDFDIIFRYQQIGWYTGDASSGAYAREGFNSGNGTEYELVGSGTNNPIYPLTILTNTAPPNPGVFEMFVRQGVVVTTADIIDGGAGQDTLVGGSGPDTFVFHAGEADGDHIVDFNPGDGDKLSLVGYGAGATFTQIDATHWQVNYGAGLHEVITFDNAAPIHSNDFSFTSSSLF